jgi:hypothetical protein
VALVTEDGEDEPLDLLRARDLEQLDRSPLRDQEPQAVRRLARLLLERDHCEHRPARAAVLGRDVSVGEALLARLPLQALVLLEVDLPGLGDPGLDRVDLLLQEAGRPGFELGRLGRKRRHRRDHAASPQ